MALIVVSVSVLIAGIASCRAVYSFFECSSPTQGELETQQRFVRAHLSDASAFDMGTADCDDNGDGYVYFTTELSPRRAQAAFLTDAVCAPHSDEGMDDIAVACASDGTQVYVYFESGEDGRTRGELSME